MNHGVNGTVIPRSPLDLRFFYVIIRCRSECLLEVRWQPSLEVCLGSCCMYDVHCGYLKVVFANIIRLLLALLRGSVQITVVLLTGLMTQYLDLIYSKLKASSSMAWKVLVCMLSCQDSLNDSYRTRNALGLWNNEKFMRARWMWVERPLPVMAIASLGHKEFNS